MPIDYQQIMEQSILRLAGLVRRRRELDSEIARLQGFVRSMAFKVPGRGSVAPDTRGKASLSADSLGITQAVAHVLQTYRMSLTPVLIRDLLPCVGFDTSRYRDPLPSIHAVLRRLVMSGQVVRREADGSHRYLWADNSGEIGCVANQQEIQPSIAERDGDST